ncbi:MAG TPA: trypsin-like peptidase domain-containing protein [Feifaniaceae bacterium]|nr:trypsin-like peptidase domain-containing protein [Feifaniaceae bacterium]
MNYESYYENLNPYDPQPPRRSGGKIALMLVVVAAVFLIIGMLLAGFLQSAAQPYTPLPGNTPSGTETLPKNTPSPSLAPLQTERPMADLDGTAPALSAEGNPIPDIVDFAAPSVVGILNYAEEGDEEAYPEDLLQGMGSGFIISSQGYILTNAHVVEGAKSLAVTLSDGEEIDAELVGVDEVSDVAVVKIDRPGIRALKLGDSDNIRVGDYVVAVGNPLGWGLEGTVTMGIISARARSITIGDHTNTYIQTDAAINVGNSGGPLVNMRGEVIGINTAKTLNAGYDEYGMAITAEGLGFALPINDVKAIAEQLITKGVVQRAALGVHISTLTEADLAKYGVTSGVLVVGVVRGGPAGVAGIEPGDIIVACDGVLVEENNQLADYVTSRPIGTDITLTIARDGQEQTITVHLVDMSGLDYDDVDTLEEE